MSVSFCHWPLQCKLPITKASPSTFTTDDQHDRNRNWCSAPHVAPFFNLWQVDYTGPFHPGRGNSLSWLGLKHFSDSKWIVDLHVTFKAIKLLENKTGKNIWDLGLGKEFFDFTLKAWSIQEKIDRFDLSKIKNFILWKTLWKGWKNQVQLGENISKAHIWQRISIQNI